MAQVLLLAFLSLTVSVSVRGQHRDGDKCAEAVELPPGTQPETVQGTPVPDALDRRACADACCKTAECDVAAVIGIGTGTGDGTAGLRCWMLRCPPGACDWLRETGVTCLAPKAVGHCRASFPRFYYDTLEQKCKSFTYGGCGGNGNNFNSEEECVAACVSPTAKALPLRDVPSDSYAEHCQAKPSVGLCRASFPRFFYNSSTGSCQRFTYGGCQGNKNNYMTEEQCLSTCSDPKRFDESKDAHTGACTALYDSGFCRAAFPKFYYNPDSGVCLPFIYGGCGGNANRYDSVEECVSSCAGAEGPTGEHGQSRRPGLGFFLVSALAVSSALLLLLFLLLSVRRKCPRARPHHHEDKQELLPEEELPHMING